MGFEPPEGGFGQGGFAEPNSRNFPPGGGNVQPLPGFSFGRDVGSGRGRTQHVAICVCTCRRPKLLARCLDSLGAQIIDANLYLRIVVVSNGPGHVSETRAAVQLFQAQAPFPVTFTHEEEANIARARNIAMGRASSMGADWVAFIDDDEIADPDWISQLMAPEYRQYPVAAGRNVLVYPRPLPFWATESHQDAPGQPLACRTSGGGNVRFHTVLLRAGLRFDERLALTGGEDTDFFSRAHDMGFQIRRIARAVTRETVHAERLTFRAQMYRTYWESACGMRRMKAEKGRAAAIAARLPTAALNIVLGALWLAASVPPMVLAFWLFAIAPRSGWLWDRGEACIAVYKRFALRGGKKIAKATGRLAAMAGHLPQPYRVVHGA